MVEGAKHLRALKFKSRGEEEQQSRHPVTVKIAGAAPVASAIGD